MGYQHISIIVNPAAGKDEPILEILEQLLSGTGIDYEILTAELPGHASKLATELAGKTEVVAVCGGDGSVMEVAQGLYGSHTPMAILPCGTANVLARELGIPVDIPRAMALLTGDDHTLLHMDMGLANDAPFCLRVNFGLMASMVYHTTSELKEKYGQLAYGVTALNDISATEPVTYHMVIDGEPVEAQGMALSVFNAGNVGKEGVCLLPQIAVNDGLLDIALLEKATVLSILQIAVSALQHTESKHLRTWHCKEVSIRVDRPQTIIIDDMESELTELTIRLAPMKLHVVVPKPA